MSAYDEVKVGVIMYRFDDHDFPQACRYEVTKVTPCTLVVEPYREPNQFYGTQRIKTKRVYKSAMVKFVYLTEAEALHSYCIRKTRQVEHVSIKMEQVELLRKEAVEMMEKAGGEPVRGPRSPMDIRAINLRRSEGEW